MKTRKFNTNVLALLFVPVFYLIGIQESNAQCTAISSITYLDCNTISVYDSSTVATGDTIDWIDVYWGDGVISTSHSPADFPLTHWYGTPGSYIYSHVIHTILGCTDSSSSIVNIYDPPTADFDSDTSCAGTPTQFTDLSTSPSSPLNSWSWDFGDGGTSNAQNPVHTYSAPGTYTACLTVTNINNCSDSYCEDVLVFTHPVADFTTSPVCEGYPTLFTDLSVANADSIVSWQWTFGDGSASTLQNPSHQYSTFGTYMVVLTVLNNLGCIDDTTMQVEVYPNPIADFAYITGCSYEVYFTDLSNANASSLVAWAWDFGDGSTSTLQNPTHTYATPGTYTVCLIVTNSNGCVDSTCYAVTVSNSTGGSGLIADFTAPDTACVLSEVWFYDNSTTCNSNIILYEWDFGDGNTGVGQNVAHTYLSNGTYSVMHTVTADSSGIFLYDTAILTIVIGNLPIADFTHEDSVCVAYPVQFTSTTSASNPSYYWDFGDGYTSTLQNPQHTYLSVGDYIVSLIVTDGNGCSDTVMHMQTIIEAIADFTYTPASPIPGDTVFFTDLSTSPNSVIIQWTWYFGDGDSTTINYPDDPDVWHIYSDSGNYIVELNVIDSNNCSSYTSQNVMVFAGNPVFPIADFSYMTSCLNQPVDFFDLSTTNGGSPLVSWFWDFGDGSTSSLQNPSHIYSAAGTYDVSLVITNADNLSDTATYSVALSPLPDVSATANTASAMPGDPIQFYGYSGDSTNIVSWTWTFGDGGTSALQNPVHIYQYANYFNVSLTVTDIAGCMNTTSIQIYIFNPPSFPEDSTIWNTVGNNSLSNQTWRFRYGLLGDTTISTTDLDTISYSKVYSLYDSTLSNPNSTYFAALRTTEDKKVYALLPGFDETLLYDFTLEVGDTIWYPIGGSLCYNGVVFTDEDHYKVVTSIDSILLENGETRKRWHLMDYPNGIMNDVWVDGIGSVDWYGLFNPFIDDITLCGDSYSFACMKEGDMVVYLNNPHCEECFCQLMTSVEENDLTRTDPIHIYPNPANDHLVVESSIKIDQLRIIDITGNVLKDMQVDNAMIRIPVTGLKNGVYIIDLRSGSNYYKKKFIIHHP